jgi:phospholipid/cholesterol/gamma-HCH transport system substrate-binding protein
VENFDQSMLEVRGASRNINLISQKVEKGEGTIGRLVNDDKALVEIEGAIKELREVISPIRDLEIDVSTHLEVRSDSANQGYFNVIFKTRPDFYYLLGVTDVSEKVIDTTKNTQEDAVIDGETTQSRTKEVIREEGNLRFNAQVAKRWNWVGARIGLFESSAGGALDLYLLDGKLRWALEVFDFDDGVEPVRKFARVKTYLSALFFDHVYVMFGADDLTRYKNSSDQKINPKIDVYGGLGLTFTDRDLRTVLGAASIGSGI